MSNNRWLMNNELESSLYGRGFQTVGRPPPPKALLVLWWGGVVCMRNILILNEMWKPRWNIFFGRHFAWLKYLTYHSVVPVLAANCTQHILSPAEVRKVCCSLFELYVKSVTLILLGWRRAWSSWNILRGGSAIYKCLGTSSIRREAVVA
jgi:hypothetical protein